MGAPGVLMGHDFFASQSHWSINDIVLFGVAVVESKHTEEIDSENSFQVLF